MTPAQLRAANSAERLLLKAVAISLGIHLAAFGGWKWGRTHAWWKPLAMPAWLQLMPHLSPSRLARQLPAAQRSQPPPPLIYIDVDPALAAAQPPANPKFYSTENTVAANPEKKVPSDQPHINGTQEQVVKTVAPGSRTVPLQPSPPVEKTAETAATETKETAESRALPKPASTAGDLVEAKPALKVQESKGTSDSATGTGAATQPAPSRPRTLAQAQEKAGAPGPRMRQPGGVNRLAEDSSVDAARTVYGDYDRDFIDAVRARWFELLKGRENDAAGKVVLEFNLHADGRISDMKMQFSNVNELLSLICQQAVLDPSLYKPWPAEMRRVISDPREIRFTFYYSY
jgi:outer membrane biosynthesis protein TonB